MKAKKREKHLIKHCKITNWQQGCNFCYREEICRENHKQEKQNKTKIQTQNILTLFQQIRKCFKYRQWRSDVFTRDNFSCQKCFKDNVKIEAHHIKMFSKIMNENKIKTYEQAINCEELWSINNGITLCIDCHCEIDKFRKLNYRP